MKRIKAKNQLDLFHTYDAKTLENQIKQLEAQITKAIREGNLRKAASLTEKQRIIIESQIFPKQKKQKKKS